MHVAPSMLACFRLKVKKEIQMPMIFSVRYCQKTVYLSDIDMWQRSHTLCLSARIPIVVSIVVDNDVLRHVARKAAKATQGC